jgi:hypothetical protein
MQVSAKGAADAWYESLEKIVNELKSSVSRLVQPVGLLSASLNLFPSKSRSRSVRRRTTMSVSRYGLNDNGG